MQPLAHKSWNNSTIQCNSLSKCRVCKIAQGTVRDVCLPILAGISAVILIEKSFIWSFAHEMGHFTAARLLASEIEATMRFYSWEGALGIKRLSPLKCLSIEFHPHVCASIENGKAHVAWSAIKWNRVGRALGNNYSKALISIAGPLTDAVILNSFLANRISHLFNTLIKNADAQTTEFRWAFSSLVFSMGLISSHLCLWGINNFSIESMQARLQEGCDIEKAAYHLHSESKISPRLCAAIMRISFTALPALAICTTTIRSLSKKG